MIRPSLAILLFFLFGFEARAQGPYFYKGREFGSEALYNPLSLLLNGSYDIIQLNGNSRAIFTLPYGRGAENVMRNLGNPFGTISRHGWSTFLRHEIIPSSLKPENGQWWPNYQLHLIGGGMTYVATREWYDAHGFPLPAAWSVTTMAAYHLLNEVVENGDLAGDNTDPIADIYFFDIPGIVLFSFDGVDRFFSETLQLADWSLQPSIALTNQTLQNNGQYFSIKWKLPFSDSYHLFYYFGMRGLVGISRKFEDSSSISIGVGVRATQLRTLDPSNDLKTVGLHVDGGIFYDRDNSLLASLFIGDYTYDLIVLNIYPGIIRFGSFSPGVWFVLNRQNGPSVGISTRWTPGLAYIRR